jgi:hypothetical protein
MRKLRLITLMDEAKRFDKTQDWFEHCNRQIDLLQRANGKLESCLNYLQANSCKEAGDEYQSVQEDELGCKIVQQVLLGNFVTPVYVFNPNKQASHKQNDETNTNMQTEQDLLS